LTPSLDDLQVTCTEVVKSDPIAESHRPIRLPRFLNYILQFSKKFFVPGIVEKFRGRFYSSLKLRHE